MAREALVTLAGPDDAPAVARLLAEMDRHYQGDTLEESEGVAQAARHLAEPENGTLYALARAGAEPVGIACFVLLRHGLRFPGSLFLKDLFVVEGARGGGAGEALLRFLASFAAAHGVSRIDLTVDAPNTAAARFYSRLGAEPCTGKIFYRFEADTVAALAADDDGTP